MQGKCGHGNYWLKSSLLGLSLLYNCSLAAQDTSSQGSQWVVGGYKQQVSFVADTISASLIGQPATWSLLYKGIASICDKRGNLQFVTDGYMVFDAKGDTISNGGAAIGNSCYASFYDNKSFGAQTTIVLPKGNMQYYIIASAMSDTACNRYFVQSTPDTFHFDEIRYTIVDMNANNSKGAIAAKNKLFHKRGKYPWLTSSCNSAVRHGNGRDWWYIKPSSQNREYKYKFLVTADSIAYVGEQYIAHDILVNDIAFEGASQSTFSQDGTLYAECSFGTKITLYNFDRCTGEFSLKRIIEPSQYRSHKHYTVPDWVGVCFSPNNRFLYLADSYHIYQFDLDEPNDQLAFLDISPEDTSANFPEYSNLTLTPSGHIWVGNWSGISPFVNAILAPNDHGINCNFKLRYAKLLSNTSEPPNLPNYSLGRLVGSPCDSLYKALQHIPPPQAWALYPNPTQGDLYIDVPDTTIGIVHIQVHNTLGQQVYYGVHKPNAYRQLQLNVSLLAAGVYYLRVQHNKQEFVSKFVKAN
ncbi:MAG: hypothetical protein RL660_1367 [Bacteroidota bacterium]